MLTSPTPFQSVTTMISPAQPVHTFTVTGMTCGHCEKSVVQAVKLLDPQAEVTADRTANRVVVSSQQTPAALMAAIAEEGYAVSPAA